MKQAGSEDAVERQRRETLGGSYLGQAIDELRSSGSPDALYQGRRPSNTVITDPKQLALFLAAVHHQARIRRVEFARSATLYCILAAEAYANQYLQSHLTGAEFDAADRLPTFDKYVLGPRLVTGADLLKRGHEPAQTLRTLLNLRSRLVHPKLRTVPPSRSVGDDPADFADFNPRDAARYLVAVAEAAAWLLVSGSTPQFDPIVAVITAQKQFFLDHGQAVTKTLPQFGSEPTPDLFITAVRRRLPSVDESQATDPGSA